jgi:N-formylglutamate deformylase
MPPFTLTRGTAPLLVSFPHVGTHVPPEIAERLTPAARAVPDTDWHVDRLYDFVQELGASTIAATHSRYVVDVNRPPDNASLYPGQAVTGIVPATDFAGASLYLEGLEPDSDEISARIERVWQPYHTALAAELARLKAAHGRVLLWEAHSIRGEVPMLFDGTLPHLNLGTNGGASCRAGRGEALLGVAEASPYSAVLNGRFKGGYITRHYGRPEEGVDAIQLELAQRTYMDEESFAFDGTLADRLRPTLRRLLETALPRLPD